MTLVPTGTRGGRVKGTIRFCMRRSIGRERIGRKNM
jgi:hypothetical protein